MSLSDDVTAQLEALADELAPQVRAGISQRLVGFLGPETIVLATDGQIVIRRYVGVIVTEVRRKRGAMRARDRVRGTRDGWGRQDRRVYCSATTRGAGRVLSGSLPLLDDEQGEFDSS